MMFNTMSTQCLSKHSRDDNLDTITKTNWYPRSSESYSKVNLMWFRKYIPLHRSKYLRQSRYYIQKKKYYYQENAYYYTYIILVEIFFLDQDLRNYIQIFCYWRVACKTPCQLTCHANMQTSLAVTVEIWGETHRVCRWDKHRGGIQTWHRGCRPLTCRSWQSC